MGFLQGVGGVGQLLLRSAALPGGWSSSPGHCKPKRLFPRAAQLGRTVRELDRSFHGLAKLVLVFLGCRPFPAGWRCLVLLCGGVAPPKGKQARAGTAPAVVGFQQLLRPASQMAGSPRPRESVGGGGGGGRGCTGKHSFLIASGPVSLLWHGEYSMGTHPFFSPLPNLGADSALLPGSL